MDESKKNGLWVMGAVVVMMAFFGALVIIATKFTAAVKEEAGAVTPVTCECSCPEQKLAGDNSITADGYNVNIVLDGQKWTPPALLSEEEQGYVTLCRKEDPELIGHPDLSFTKTYKLWHECQDDLYTVRAGFDDEANQCCWQQDIFELPIPPPIHVPHQMTEAERQEELRMLVGPDGEKYR